MLKIILIVISPIIGVMSIVFVIGFFRTMFVSIFGWKEELGSIGGTLDRNIKPACDGSKIILYVNTVEQIILELIKYERIDNKGFILKIIINDQDDSRSSYIEVLLNKYAIQYEVANEEHAIIADFGKDVDSAGLIIKELYIGIFDCSQNSMIHFKKKGRFRPTFQYLPVNW